MPKDVGDDFPDNRLMQLFLGHLLRLILNEEGLGNRSELLWLHVRVVHHSCDELLLWWLVRVLVDDNRDHRRWMHVVVDSSREMRGAATSGFDLGAI